MAAVRKIARLQEELNDEQANPAKALVLVPSPLSGQAYVNGAVTGLTNLLGVLEKTKIYLTNAAVISPVPSMEMTRLDDDFHSWLVDQAQALHARRSDLLDWDALAEELEAMAARERREGKKQLRNLLAHLLKWSFQSEQLPRRAHSWRRTIRETREELNDLLEDSPGLVTPLKNAFSKVYDRARSKASDDTRLPLDRFPAISPWTFDDALAEEFWPEPATTP
jgi:hypothetical protein